MRSGGRSVEAATTAVGDQNALVEVGRIVNLHGVRGEVRMLPHNPTTTILAHGRAVTLRGADGTLDARQLLGVRRHKRYLLLRLEACDTFDAAALLVGRAVCVARSELPPLGEQEYYHIELVGCTVRTEAGTSVGVITEMLSTASNDVCVVRDAEREVLIPLVADIVVHIDRARREMVVREIPGLLDP